MPRVRRSAIGVPRAALGVLLVLFTVASLAGFLCLFAGVGMMRLARERAAGDTPSSASAPAAGPSLSRADQPTRQPREPEHSVATTGPPGVPTPADAPGAEPPRRVAPAGLAGTAGDRTKPQKPAPVAPAIPEARHATASLLRVDEDSAGGWVGRYGERGYSLAMAGEPTSLPPGVSMAMARSHLYLWSPVTTDPRGLSVPANPSRQSAGQWFSWDNFSLDLDLRGRGEDLQVALYLVDWDSDARAQRVEVADGESGVVLLSRSDEHFRKGRYLLLRLSGHVKLRFTKTAGANCTLSAIFLDDLPPPAP